MKIYICKCHEKPIARSSKAFGGKESSLGTWRCPITHTKCSVKVINKKRNEEVY